MSDKDNDSTKDTKKCKEPTGFFAKNPGGYFIVNPNSWDGHSKLHRWVYAKHFNIEIPKGLEVRHLCHNPGCIEITHLELGTHAENMADTRKAHRGRAPTELTTKDIKRIRKLYGTTDMTQQEIGNLYRIPRTCVNDIINKKTFKWVK